MTIDFGMELVLKNIFITAIFKHFVMFTRFHYIQTVFLLCDRKQDFYTLPWIHSYSVSPLFLVFSLSVCTCPKLKTAYKQATITALIQNISLGRQSLEKRKVFKREFSQQSVLWENAMHFPPQNQFL